MSDEKIRDHKLATNNDDDHSSSKALETPIAERESEDANQEKGSQPRKEEEKADVIEQIREILLNIDLSDASPLQSSRNVAEPAASNNNPNTCMALVPVHAPGPLSAHIPSNPQGKPSLSTDCNNSGGIMQLITGTNNKVAPEITPEATSPTVLMIIPKKSDTVCIQMPQDQGNAQGCSQTDSANANTLGNNVPEVGAVSSDPALVKQSRSCDSYEEVCRICHDNPSKLELMSPCLCKGSMSKVHRTCLERWLGESGKNSCEICGYEYNTVRTSKYKGCRSFFEWIRHPLSASDTRNLFFDIACFFILTPLAAISSWLCVVGAQHYSFGEESKRRMRIQDLSPPSHGRNGMRDASNATWTSVGLLSLTGTLLAAYYIWLFVAVRYHIQVWREWQQRNFIVSIVPFEDGCMGRPPPARVRPADNGSTQRNNQDRRISSTTSTSHGRNLRHNHHTSTFDNNNFMPQIFNRNNFLNTPLPGFTLSETELVYQAICGSDSDANFVLENVLDFPGDANNPSSDETRETEASSSVTVPSERSLGTWVLDTACLAKTPETKTQPPRSISEQIQRAPAPTEQDVEAGGSGSPCGSQLTTSERDQNQAEQLHHKEDSNDNTVTTALPVSVSEPTTITIDIDNGQQNGPEMV